MAKWGVTGNKGAASVQVVLNISAAAANMRRIKLYDWAFGCGAAPGDNAFIWVAQRSATTLPTGATPVPNALDPADTLVCTAQVRDTVIADAGLTAGAFLYHVPLNQRASFRWVAAPGGEMVIPAVATAGISLALSAVSTTTMNAGAMFEEQLWLL